MPNRGAHSGSETSGTRSQDQTQMADKSRRDDENKSGKNAQSSNDGSRGQSGSGDRNDRRS